MDYIKVTFNEMPRVLFSHKHEAAAFTFHFSKSDVFLEICYVDVGDLFAECDNGDMVHTKAGTLSVSWNKPKTSSSHGEFHRHFTAAIGGQCRTELLSQKEATETLKKNAVEDENSYTVLLPKKIEDAKYAKQGASIIKSIIYERNLPKVNLLKVNTLVFNLLDLINTYATEQIRSSHRNQSFSEENYCRKAISYMSRHRTEKINVATIAKELGLSTGYLSRIFKINTGYTLVEYMNDIKINMVKEILASREASLDELASIVGLNDEKYLCRLFKKHTGMTITEFKATAKEI